jgi:hypothetical protein
MRVAPIILVAAFAVTAAADDEPIDAQKWLSARGVEGEIDPVRSPFGCSEIAVGKPRERALLCVEVEETIAGTEAEPVYRVITHQTLTVVRASTAITVLDAETALQALDANPGMPPLIGATLRIAPDGLSAKIEMKSPDTCKHLTTPKDPWERFDFDVRRRMCGARGTYAWKNGRFRLRS